jgi:hypothetical protein
VYEYYNSTNYCYSIKVLLSGYNVRSHSSHGDYPRVVHKLALLPCPVLWSPTTCFIVSYFHQHTALTLSYLTTIWWVLVSCSYSTQSTFCCSPLCCVLETMLLLVASLWKIQFFCSKMPVATKWSSLMHSCMLPHLAVRPLCPQRGNTKPRCKLTPPYCNCLSSSQETSTAH